MEERTMIRRQESLDYHSRERRGKIELAVTKPILTQRDLMCAYMPGVTEPCALIAENPDRAYDYTARQNLVAVITDGSAVLTLGNIGPLAAKPMMEGKSVLFKRFADIDAFDIELNTQDPEEFIGAVRLLEPTFGGICLEDVASPKCFFIDEELRKQMQIPVFHDKQHGAATASAAALLNALELQEKRLEDVRLVVAGSGPSGIGCANLLLKLGVCADNIVMTDVRGVLYQGRDGEMNPYEARFARSTEARTLADAMEGADVFIGCSVGGLVTRKMVASMADRPVILALASPDPEIAYYEARSVRADLIMATRRSDCPNEFSNTLAFPFILRGALDVRATAINDEMMLATARALAELAREGLPKELAEAYGEQAMHFGPEHILPKPLDPRILFRVAPAVARAAIESGVARRKVDPDQYRERLHRILSLAQQIVRVFIQKAQSSPKRIAFPEGDNERILKACQMIVDEHVAKPVLLGPKRVIEDQFRLLDLDLRGYVEIVDPTESADLERYCELVLRKRNRRGMTLPDARKLLRRRNYFAMAMLAAGDVDGVVTGQTMDYGEAVRPALQVVGLREGVKRAAGMYMVVSKNAVKFFADTTVNLEPDEETIAEVAIVCADSVRELGVEPRIALLSFSNFGSMRHHLAEKMARATEMVRSVRPDLEIDGEMQANVALDGDLIKELYPFCHLKGEANVLIFPNLDAGNIAYKLMERFGGAEVIGPILMGMQRPVTVLERACSVSSIVYNTTITAVKAQGGFEKESRVTIFNMMDQMIDERD
jgi:malate dehydrogenase (oxaloacetate-decarboxylating)(NADP+)